MTDRVINGVSDKVAALRSERGRRSADAFNREEADRLARLDARHKHWISEIPNPIVREGVKRHLDDIREMS